MRRELFWRLALAALALLACVWTFWPAVTLVRTAVVPILRYVSRGIDLALDDHGRVRSVSTYLRSRPDGTLLWPSGVQRPARTAIVPAVGCCGVQFGDSEEDVLSALGEPLRRRRHVGYNCTWYYPNLDVFLELGRASHVRTWRPTARTPEGVGIGSTRDQVVEALGPPETQWPIGAEGQRTSVEFMASAPRWYSVLAVEVLRALVISLAVCLLLRLVRRGPAWATIAAACIGVWIAYPLLWLLEQWLPQLVSAWSRGPRGPGEVLDDFLGRLTGHGAPARMTEMGYTLQTLRDWLAAPMPKGYAFGAILGMFVAGRLASRWSWRTRVIWATACLGGIAIGMVASRAEAAIVANAPRYVEWLWPVWPLHFAALLSVAFASGFLLVAHQRQSWWDTTRRALGLPGVGEAQSH